MRADRRYRVLAVERTPRIRKTTNEHYAAGHFAIGSDRRILEWDVAATHLLGVPEDKALGLTCCQVVGGRSDFGCPVCGPTCPASRALSAGRVAGTSRLLARAAGGARLRLACDLIALPSGAALGRLRAAGDATVDRAHDLAGVAALTTRVSGEGLQQGLRDTLDFLLHATVADAGEVFNAEPHGQGVVRTCHRGCFARAFGEVLRFDAGEGFPGLVLSQGQAAYTDHLADDSRFLRTRVKREGFSTYVCAPLTSRSEALGCFALAFRRSDIDLDRVLNLLRWAGTPMGLILETALGHLREATSMRLRGIQEDPQNRVPQALRALLQEIVRLSSADGGELVLPWQGKELRLLAQGTDAALGCPALNAAAIRKCPSFETGRTIILHGRRMTWPPACRDAVHPGGAWCCIPIACDGASLGMIRLLYRRLRPFPPNENLALIEALASLAAEKLRDVLDQLAKTPQADVLHDWQQRHPAMESAETGQRLTRRARSTQTRKHSGAPHLEVRCFGSFELSVGGARVASAVVRRKRVLTLLGILLAHHDQPQCKDTLIELLWPGADPTVRTRQFHVLVHELRKLLEPDSRGRDWVYVRNRADRYAFITQSSCWIDTLEFLALHELGRKAESAHEEQAAIGAYEAAAELYRGDYMQDEPFAEWCRPTREQLREACLGALSRLAALWSSRGRWDRCISWSRRALLLDPLREEMHRTLMYALWASGRRDEAVRQYEACTHLLRERLDLTPLPETEQLLTRIRATPRPQLAG